MHLHPHLHLSALLFLFASTVHTQSCSGVGYRDACCPGLIIGTVSNANNLDGLTCCSGDPTHALRIGLSSCTAGTSVAMTALASVSDGVSAETTMPTTTKGSAVTGKGPKTSMEGSGSSTLTGASESSTSTMPTVETVGGTTTRTTSSTAGGAMITQGPLLLVGGAAALFAYGVM